MESSFLTPEQRARLRPSVDVAALERLLAAVPAEARLGLVVACFAEITPEELREVGAEVPDNAAETRPASHRGRPAHLPPQHSDFMIEFDDPHLARLWDEVEPGCQQADEVG